MEKDELSFTAKVAQFILNTDVNDYEIVDAGEQAQLKWELENLKSCKQENELTIKALKAENERTSRENQKAQTLNKFLIDMLNIQGKLPKCPVCGEEMLISNDAIRPLGPGYTVREQLASGDEYVRGYTLTCQKCQITRKCTTKELIYEILKIKGEDI